MGDERASLVHIERLVDLTAGGHDRGALLTGVVAIFRATAARWPTDPIAAVAFQELWLDQYLRHEPDLVFVAVDRAARSSAPKVVGYLVGCRVDPGLSLRFEALGYFQNFAAVSADFPAHLHVNVDAAYRSRRVGERLVEALCARLVSEGVPGVHVVTGCDQRNVGFYGRLGFSERARTPRGRTEVVFLARGLIDSP